jgi:hypothetical protein
MFAFSKRMGVFSHKEETPRIIDTYPEVYFVGSGLPEKQPEDAS